jgi:hypothetical protein
LVEGVRHLLEHVVIINEYSSDPNRRMTELINQSEDLRKIEEEYHRIWFTDQPSHLTVEMKAREQAAKPECSVQDVCETLARWFGRVGGLVSPPILIDSDSDNIGGMIEPAPPVKWRIFPQPPERQYERVHGGIQ